MKFTSESMPDSVRRKLPPTDPMHLGPSSAGMFQPDSVKRDKHEAKLEKEIQNQIANYLNLRGIVFMWQRTDKRATGTVGWPDFTLAYKLTPIGFEVKRPGEKPEPEQSKMHDKMIANGWSVYVVHSVEEVKAILDKI